MAGNSYKTITIRGANNNNVHDYSMVEATVKVLTAHPVAQSLADPVESLDGSLVQRGGERYRYDITTPAFTTSVASAFDFGDIENLRRVLRKDYLWIYACTLTRTTTINGVDQNYWAMNCPVAVVRSAFDVSPNPAAANATASITLLSRSVTLS